MTLSAILTTPALRQALGFYKRNKALCVETIGINLPRTLIVRNPQEAIDVGFNEAINTIGYFGGLSLLSRATDQYLKKVRPNILKNRLWYQSCKTSFLMPIFFGFMMATPFLRNALTSWRNHTANYQDLITGQHQTANQWQQAVQQNLGKATKLMLGGTGIGLAGLLYCIKSPKTVLSLLKNNPSLKHGLMGGTKGHKLANSFQALAYWGFPAYTSWILAARDQFETKEQFLKMINFMVMFAVPGFLINKAFAPQLKHWIKTYPNLFNQKQFIGLKTNPKLLKGQTLTMLNQTKQAIQTHLDKEQLFDFAASTTLQAVTPAFINLYLTQKRLEAAQEKRQQAQRFYSQYDSTY